jgi:hypothetical protein
MKATEQNAKKPAVVSYNHKFSSAKSFREFIKRMDIKQRSECLS